MILTRNKGSREEASKVISKDSDVSKGTHTDNKSRRQKRQKRKKRKREKGKRRPGSVIFPFYI